MSYLFCPYIKVKQPLKHTSRRFNPRPKLFILKSFIILAAVFFIASLLYFFFASIVGSPETLSLVGQQHLKGDLRDANFPWNKLCLHQHPKSSSLQFSPRHGLLVQALVAWNVMFLLCALLLLREATKIHVFTAPSDRRLHKDIHDCNLHVYFAPINHCSVSCSLAFDIFDHENRISPFDYEHTESVSLPYWRARPVPRLAVTWHGIWHEIIHSKLFQELLANPNGQLPGPMTTELQEAMPRLLDEIRFFSSYAQHICISNSAGEVLVNIYQLPHRNVRIILNGVDDTKFLYHPGAGTKFPEKYGVPSCEPSEGSCRASVNCASQIEFRSFSHITGRLIRDKGHPLLYEAFTKITQQNPGVFLLVAGSGPWGKKYVELGSIVKILGPLEPSDLSKFCNIVLDVFVNPTLRLQGLDLTLMEAMHCGKPVLTPNFPSIKRTVVLNEEFGYAFSPNVNSLIEALESAIRDGPTILQRKGMLCRKYATSMFKASKMASSYEQFFLCMKNSRYCQYPLPCDC